MDYEQLAAALTAQSQKTTGTASTVMAHGPGGLLSNLGMRPGVANAMVMPITGLAGILPIRPSTESNPLRGIFTGVTASTGSEPTTRCEDPPSAGVSQLCTTTAVWGWFGRSSREVRLDLFGRTINRGEFTDMQLMGDPFAANSTPRIPGGDPKALNSEISKILFELSVAMVRDSARDMFTGNPTNNTGTPGNGGREYYRGLDLLIDTGYVDVVTGVACTAADPIVLDYNANISTNGTGMVRTATYVFRNLNFIAEQTGMGTVDFTIAMRWSLFYELTSIWPCSYQTYRCDVDGTNNRAVSSREDMNKFTDSMRAGKFLLIDGMQVPVTIDNAISETETEAGIFQSDMYFIPLRASGIGLGNAPLSEGGNILTYMEYFDFGNDNLTAGRAAMAPPGTYEVTPNGRNLFHRQSPTNLCMKIAGWSQERLILETPYLSARITNISYSPLLHEREAFIGDPYFVNGGRSDYVGYGPSYEAPN